MNKFDTMSKDAMNRVEEIMNSTRLNEFLHRKEQEEKKKNNILWVFAIIGAVAAVAAIAYGVYRFFTPDYLEDFEDDFDDDFDDDFFEDDLDSTSKQLNDEMVWKSVSRILRHAFLRVWEEMGQE